MKLDTPTTIGIVLGISWLLYGNVWQAKIPTYDELQSDNFEMTTKQKQKVYESEGWQLGGVFPKGAVQKIKLINCMHGKCMYYRRNADDMSKSQVYAHEISCPNEQYRLKDHRGGKWSAWYPIAFNANILETNAYQKYCN